ncbi:MAG: hypothetical protein KUL82_01665, partial [Bdellovibrio sp.]|nr:hypothetical protein [Bdellovibrio sp.]
MIKFPTAKPIGRFVKYRVFLSAFFFLLPQLGHAEYRVFLLKISKKGPQAVEGSATPPSPDFRLVESTLDHIQYRYYYPVAADEEVTYIDTWRCYGRTDGFQPHCPN